MIKFNKHKDNPAFNTKNYTKKVVGEACESLEACGIDFVLVYAHPSTDDELQVVTTSLTNIDAEQQDNSFYISMKLEVPQ